MPKRIKPSGAHYRKLVKEKNQTPDKTIKTNSYPRSLSANEDCSSSIMQMHNENEIIQKRGVAVRKMTDPADWNMSEFTIDYVCKNGYSQNLDSNFSRSKQLYQRVRKGSFRNAHSQKVRVQFFTFLVIYFKNSSEFSRNGFSDWKRSKSNNKHENSLSHKYQTETEKAYWKNVLTRRLCCREIFIILGLAI
ncbi:Hypothetical protein CINCED_3A012655 [Cinara cedri]|uniref:Uncharacterized protein n=1 Tax=Cinara cedri TaxID=506608 RepID=A0A5E4M205_9HEMI|nr:Hypothetical protein CINCED_3A012655 [Cinara cedri]